MGLPSRALLSALRVANGDDGVIFPLVRGNPEGDPSRGVIILGEFGANRLALLPFSPGPFIYALRGMSVFSSLLLLCLWWCK